MGVPTTGAPGIFPGILITLQDLHRLPDCTIQRVTTSSWNCFNHRAKPVAGLVEVSYIVRNANVAAFAFSSAQIANAGANPIIPLDHCQQAIGEWVKMWKTNIKGSL